MKHTSYNIFKENALKLRISKVFESTGILLLLRIIFYLPFIVIVLTLSIPLALIRFLINAIEYGLEQSTFFNQEKISEKNFHWIQLISYLNPLKIIFSFVLFGLNFSYFFIEGLINLFSVILTLSFETFLN